MEICGGSACTRRRFSKCRSAIGTESPSIESTISFLKRSAYRVNLMSASPSARIPASKGAHTTRRSSALYWYRSGSP